MRSDPPPLLPIFRSRHQGELLAVVYLHPDREYTLAELSRRLDIPPTTVQREIGRLAQAGLIKERQVGRARMISVNDASRFNRSLTELVMYSFGPHVVVEEEFEGTTGVTAVAIYGSWAARYTGEPGPPPNDIDVLVIGGPDRTDVYEAADRAERRLEIPVNPTVCSVSRWEAAADALIQQIKSAPIVWVYSVQVGDEK
jgi:DNA-binding transcriptional ArsR family regulator